MAVAPKKYSASHLCVVLLASLTLSLLTSPTSQAGFFDCIKARKWSGYNSLRSAYFKNPELRTSSDWINSYLFARLFTGYSDCFDKKDVRVMRKYVNTINSFCIQNPNWSTVCRISGGTGKMSDWVYDNSK